jgi:hypothetical protein
MSHRAGAEPPPYGNRVEFAVARKVRERNTLTYRVLHWPVWAWVFFLLPGPLIAGLFHRGFDARIGAWIACVLAGTGVAAYFGMLPGTETRPYVMFFTEDKPNPAYRRFCYTVAWGVIAGYPAVNIMGLLVTILSGRWMMHQLYAALFVPVMACMWLLGALGRLPRTKTSVQYEGYERRVFYGAVWTVTLAQVVLWGFWKALPRGPAADATMLGVFAALMAGVGWLAWRGYLPRTRPIVPGQPFTLD